MSKNKKVLSLITSILISIFILSFSIIITLNFRQIYYFDIKYLGISDVVKLKESELKENYDTIINYILDKNITNLNLSQFEMSANGRIHFQDVKNIFRKTNFIMYLSGFISLILFIINLKKSNFLFLKYTSIITVITPLVFIVLSIFNFNWLFNNLHNIIFKNNYWLFDPETDPVINALPEAFFMHELVLILIILLTMGIANYIAYTKLTKISLNTFNTK